MPTPRRQVRLTVVEIYCERVCDLLDPLGRDNLAIKQGRDGGTYVEGGHAQQTACGRQLLSATQCLGLELAGAAVPSAFVKCSCACHAKQCKPGAALATPLAAQVRPRCA